MFKPGWYKKCDGIPRENHYYDATINKESVNIKVGLCGVSAYESSLRRDKGRHCPTCERLFKEIVEKRASENRVLCTRCGVVLRDWGKVVNTPYAITATKGETYLICKDCYEEFEEFSHILHEMENMAIRMFVRGEA